MLNLVGHLEAEVGVGEVARQLVGACDAAGVPVLPVSLPAWASRQGHPFPHAASPVAAFGTTLVCLNADQLPRAWRDLRSVRHRRRVIGLWWWEVDVLPPWLAESFDLVDEVWAGSPWLADVLARAAGERATARAVRSVEAGGAGSAAARGGAGSAAARGGAVAVPVRHLPLPVRVPEPARLDRGALGLPEDAFLVGTAFDHHSVLARKHPLGLIAAYRQAFGPDDGAALVVKSVNGHAHPADHAAVRAACADRPDILVRDGYLDAADKDALVAACDVWGSLHRSEGFGLTLAEALALGVPVLATGGSGNAELTTAATAWVVPSVSVAVGPGHDPYPAEATWAEPDLAAAAALLRRLRAEPDERARRSAAGRALIATRHAPAVTGAAIRALLADAPPGPPPHPPATRLVELLNARRAAPPARDVHNRPAVGYERGPRGLASTPRAPTVAPPPPGGSPHRRGGTTLGAMGGPADSPDAARLARAQALLADAERALADAERRAAQVEVTGLERDEARAEADELATRLEVAAADNGKLLEQLEVARRIQDDMLASVSWRVTKPLRAAKDRARR